MGVNNSVMAQKQLRRPLHPEIMCGGFFFILVNTVELKTGIHFYLNIGIGVDEHVMKPKT